MRPAACTSPLARPSPELTLTRSKHRDARRAHDRRARSADFGRFVLALQALASALHGGDELRQVDLERVQDLIGVVLRAEPDLALARAGVLDDVLGGALGLLGDLLLADAAAPGARARP